MSLIELVDNTRTDKNNIHSYLNLYHDLLKYRKNKAKNILEIGIGPDLSFPFYHEGYLFNSNGGSIKLWKDYFENAQIYTIDSIPINNVWEGIKNDERIHLLTSQNAYDKNTVEKEFLSKNIKFDFIIDDGPRNIKNMVNFIILYSSLLEEDGILIIEDVQSIDWIDILECVTPIHLKKYIKVYDLRSIKGRYDDIVFVIDKSLNV